jgi:hypothetical protein
MELILGITHIKLLTCCNYLALLLFFHPSAVLFASFSLFVSDAVAVTTVSAAATVATTAWFMALTAVNSSHNTVNNCQG